MHQIADLREAVEHHRREAMEVFQLLRDDEPGTRRLLWELRETPSYEAAFTDPEPLVSVVIPTYTNREALIETALPSVLGQTYERLEVIVVGDAAPPELERAVKEISDARVRFVNLPFRGPYPDEQMQRWAVAGGPPVNEAIRLARGAWIAQTDDDDRNAPERVELLLKAARERRLEFCYGQIRLHRPDGTDELINRFPPNIHASSLNCSLMHAGLRFVVAELGDSFFSLPGDWQRIRRMMRIGVRMGMIDDVVLDYYPSLLWDEAHRDG